MPCARNRRHVARVHAGTDDGRVSHPPWLLVDQPPSAPRRRDVAILVLDNAPHCRVLLLKRPGSDFLLAEGALRHRLAWDVLCPAPLPFRGGCPDELDGIQLRRFGHLDPSLLLLLRLANDTVTRLDVRVLDTKLRDLLEGLACGRVVLLGCIQLAAVIKDHDPLRARLEELVVPFLHEEVVWVSPLETVREAKLLRSRAHDEDVRCLLHHSPCQPDGILDQPDACTGASVPGRAIHDRGVHLLRACVGEDAPLAGVEEGTVLKQARDGLGHVDSVRPPLEQALALLEDLPELVQALVDGVHVLDLASPAMHGDGPFDRLFALEAVLSRLHPQARGH
mmetsp:Transcript_65192/g.160532  ORF Transcript_65192/g.160532 Transcript_65192/m.160532 type:complete len:337 (+) Transcript_65192:553-1563(+)